MDEDHNMFENKILEEEVKEYQSWRTKPLKDEEIEEAKMLISERHPLRDSPVLTLFPTLNELKNTIIRIKESRREKERVN